MVRLKASVTADRDLALNELKDDYAARDKLLDRAAGKLNSPRNKPEVDSRSDLAALRDEITGQYERLHKVAQFYALSNEVERRTFFADDDRAEAAAIAAVDLFSALTDPQWSAHLPASDLSPVQRDHLQEAVFRQLLFLGSLRARRGLSAAAGPQSAAALRAAMAAMAAADRWKPSESARLLRLVCEMHLAAAATGKLPMTPPQSSPPQSSQPESSPPLEPSCAADDYFLGLLYFRVARAPRDPISVALARIEPLAKVDFTDALDASGRLLRCAASRAPRHYWTYFWLGLNRLAAKKFAGAELAFDAGIALRPDEPLGYAYRGWALVQESQPMKNGAVKDSLQVRGLADLDHARSIDPTNSDFAWLDAKALTAAGRKRDAFPAFQRAIALEPPAENRALGRADGEEQADGDRQADVGEMLGLARRTTDDDPRNLAAWVALASASWQLGKLDDADQAAGKALALAADQPIALAVRGRVALRRNKFASASADFRTALAKQPKLWWAAWARQKRPKAKPRPSRRWADSITWQRSQKPIGKQRPLSGAVRGCCPACTGRKKRPRPSERPGRRPPRATSDE